MPTVETNGIETYYERHGEGQPIVFVHGLTADQRTWAPQVEALKDDYEVITYDYRGHGETRKGSVSGVTVQMLATDLRVLIEELGLSSPILCGHSYGGVIISEYYRQYPDDVAGLVYTDARLNIGEALWERVYIRSLPLIPVADSIIGEQRRKSIGMKLAQFVADGTVNAATNIDALDMTVGEYYADASEDFTLSDKHTFMRTASADFEPIEIPQADVPILYLYGDEGAAIFEQRTQEFAEQDGVRTREIEGSAHFVSLEQPAEFNQALKDFMFTVHEEESPVADEAA